MSTRPLDPPSTALTDEDQLPADALLEATWEQRGRPIRGSELRLELGTNVLFLAAAAALALTSTSPAGIEPIAAVVVMAYALATRVEFPIGAAFFVPTQLMLVPLFAVAPAQIVPLLVFAAFALGAVYAAATRAANIDRLVFSAGDAAHSLGPAIVITLFAHGDATHASAWLIAAAFAAQIVADLGSSSLHELVAMGSTPRVHLRQMLTIWGVDTALGTVGLLAAWKALDSPWAALTPVPLMLLLQQLAVDRVRRIDAAHERLVALELERGRSEAASALAEQQTEFLQDASHELRTPVTIARGHIENLVRTTGGVPEAEVALDELARIERIVERLLLLARTDQPSTLHLVRLDAEQFLEDCFVRWSDTVPRPWQLAELAPGTLTADGDALRAALDALIENAVNHTTTTQQIQLRSSIADGQLAIEVADHGSGIPSDALLHIFDRFARAGGPTSRTTSGVGLGLAMVDAVAKAHGGSCAVQSSPGGSVFVLRLPGFEAS